MPARTVGQLSHLLGSYVRASGLGGPDFMATLNQVLENAYSWGIWKDLTFEATVPVLGGSIALPYGADSVLYYMNDGSPGTRIRPLWDDYKNAGTFCSLGLIDDGYHVGSSDLDGDTGDYSIVFTTSSSSDTFTGDESFTLVVTIADVRQSLTLTPTAGSTSVATPSTIDEVHSITWKNVAASLVQVSLNNADDDLDVDEWAWIPEPEGVLRTRRFRLPAGLDGQTVFTALFKRRHIPVSRDTDIVHIGNSNALKHGMLAVSAEDYADLEKAEYHWGQCRKILDEELGSAETGTVSSIQLDLYGGQGPIPTTL